jgi:hypothetical protein
MITIDADFSQANCPLQYRRDDDEEWRGTPYQVADAGHDRAAALALVIEWLEVYA